MFISGFQYCAYLLLILAICAILAQVFNSKYYNIIEKALLAVSISMIVLLFWIIVFTTLAYFGIDIGYYFLNPNY
jgi:hypothetical protein